MEIKAEDLIITEITKNRGGFKTPVFKGIKIYHKPTGIEVLRDDANSQHRNRASAMDDLQTQLNKLAEKVIERNSFSNSSIVEPRPGKPHIVFVGGLWRVSSWKRNTGQLYYRAHDFIRRLNAEITCVQRMLMNCKFGK